MGACAKVGCEAEKARWVPSLLLWAKTTPPAARVPGNASSLMIPLQICDEHKESMTAQDLISDEGWSQICMVLVLSGRAAPDRESAQLVWGDSSEAS